MGGISHSSSSGTSLNGDSTSAKPRRASVPRTPIAAENYGFQPLPRRHSGRRDGPAPERFKLDTERQLDLT